MEIPSCEVDLKFQRIRGSEGPEHVEIPSYEVDLEDQKALSSRHRLGLSTFVRPSKNRFVDPPYEAIRNIWKTMQAWLSQNLWPPKRNNSNREQRTEPQTTD